MNPKFQTSNRRSSARLHQSVLLVLALAAAVSVRAVDLVYARDGSGVYGYKDTPIQPWSGYHVHDPDRPAPRRVDPGPPSESMPATPPADAIVLFNGHDLSQWEPSDWQVKKGDLVAVGDTVLRTKASFGDCQIHLEWQTPNPPRGDRFNRGNNGVFLMGLYEIQVFDSYNEKIYPDGQAAAVYGQTPPLVNVCRPPGQWQTYDIFFQAPQFTSGHLTRPARVTVIQNGVLVQWNTEIYGETGHRILAHYTKRVSRGPLALGAHHNPVRFRNIWIRSLP